MPVEITPAPIVRQGHGLLSGATIDPAGAGPDNHWWSGITIAAPGCGPGGVFDVCSTAQRPAAAEATTATAIPFVVEGPPLKCTTANQGDLGERARLGLEAILQSRIENEFWTDSLNQNPNALVHMAAGGIIGAGTAYSPATGLAALIGAAGSRQITIHAPAAVAVAWSAGNLLSSGARLESSVGRHIIVAGDGYPGTPPAAYVGAPNGPDEAWVFATGPVKVLASAVTTNGSLDQAKNMDEARAERVVGVIHDQCVWFALKIDLCKGCCS